MWYQGLIKILRRNIFYRIVSKGQDDEVVRCWVGRAAANIDILTNPWGGNSPCKLFHPCYVCMSCLLFPLNFINTLLSNTYFSIKLNLVLLV